MMWHPACKITKLSAIAALVSVLSSLFVYYITFYASKGRTIPENNFTNGISNNTGNLEKRLPKAIIIGSAKSGTRALLVFLKIHPDVRACPYEVHFFDRDENYALGLEWYRKRMPKSTSNQVTIEKSPGYFVSTNAPERVFNMSKDVKLLVIVRDPTQRAISDYTQLALRPNSSLPRFEDYVMRNNNILSTERGVVKFGVYIRYLWNWMKFFPLSQIHFVSGEELVENPTAELKLVERFLTLRPVINENNFYFDKKKGFPCFIGKIGFDGKTKSGCLKGSKGRKHTPVSQHILTRLHNYYQPYNEELYKVVKRNFHWPQSS